MSDPKKNKWLKVFSQSGHAAVRLICFPYAGGSAQVFKNWAKWLPKSIELCALQYPGRGSRFTEPAITDMTEMLDALEANLTGVLDKPFVFFGHSLGAGIAFDLTRRLEKKGFEPKYLIVSGRNAPHVEVDREEVHSLPDPEFQAKLAEMNGTPQEVLDHPELMELMLPLLRADFTLSETAEFDKETKVNCPMAAFGGLKDEDVPEEGIEGWGKYSDNFKYHMLPGDHFFLAAEQSEEALLRGIVGYITK
ncbi:MAG: thioesterase domain-containing protein [Acidobacteriota bacterium]|nr:thioesterase domain-containing protein [Acidobacteriota bacterium]